MEIKKNYLILLLITIIIPSVDEYIVNLYGIPMANVMIDTKDTIYNKMSAVKLVYKTNTNKITSTIFNIENIYETIIEKESLKILSFKKSTFQPNITNHLYTNYINDTVKYHKSNVFIPNNSFNIFSLLYYLSNKPYESIKDSVIVEREGLMYNCILSKSKINNEIEFKLNLNLINNINNAVIEHTDIFTWALFKKGGNNKVIIKDSKIKSCQFKSGITNLKAYLK
jgi:hypothetical protein